MPTLALLRASKAILPILAAIATSALAASPSANVKSDGRGGFTLSPAGLDTWTVEIEPGGTASRAVTQDTVNLEYALASAAHGATVRLGAGDFRVSRQIAVPSFQGTIAGSRSPGSTTRSPPRASSARSWSTRSWPTTASRAAA